jgi:hypothetical protein
MRFWIAAALFTFGLLDLEFGPRATRWESRATAAPSESQDQILMEGGDGYPPR